MPTRFAHVNIVAHDVDALVAFYEHVFACVRLEPERLLSGEWLERGTATPGLSLRGIHLRLPGGADDGPVIEIFKLDELGPDVPPEVRRAGLMHLAFFVDDVAETLDRIVAAGGARFGEPVVADVEGLGTADFVYARDPEGNIVELLRWRTTT